jgi:hypothetical protein
MERAHGEASTTIGARQQCLFQEGRSPAIRLNRKHDQEIDSHHGLLRSVAPLTMSVVPACFAARLGLDMFAFYGPVMGDLLVRPRTDRGVRRQQ